MSPKRRVQKHVEERVDAAVGGGNEARDVNTCVQVVAAPAILQGEGGLESGQEKRCTIGSPHQQENNHDGEHKLENVVHPRPGPQCFSHRHVANYTNQQRNKKSHDVHLYDEEMLPESLMVRREMQPLPGAPVLQALHSHLRFEFGQRDQSGCYPCQDTRADATGHLPGGGGQAPHVTKYQVPLCCQKDIEKRLPVQAHGGESGEDCTQGRAQRPPVGGTVSLEWQGQQETQIRNGQVEEIDVLHLSECFIFDQDQQKQQVVHETRQEDRGVDPRHQLGGQALGVISGALLCVTDIHIVVYEDVVIIWG